MKSIKVLLAAVVLTGTTGLSAVPVWAMPTEDARVKVAATPQGNYCHMKFPAIREDTLSWNHPVLKDSDTSDIVDFYGSCNHDPVGKDEIRTQQAYRSRSFLQSE